MTPRVHKVVLAYSGGLDTSIIIPWLKENYGAEVIAFAADIGQGEELIGLEEKAMRTGASKCIIEDLRDEFVREFVFPTLRGRSRLRAQVSARHFLRPPADRTQAGGDRRAGGGRRRGARLHRQRQRPGALRAGLQGPQSHAQDHRSLARVGHQVARAGDRLRAGPQDPDHGIAREDLQRRPQPLAPEPRGRRAGGSLERTGGAHVYAHGLAGEGSGPAPVRGDRFRKWHADCRRRPAATSRRAARRRSTASAAPMRSAASTWSRTAWWA